MDFRIGIIGIVGCICAVSFLPAPAAGQETVAEKDHPWARFQPGAWRKVRIVTEALDEAGDVVGSSVTESSSYLIDVSETSYALEIDTSVEVAGKRLPSKLQLEELDLPADLGLAGEDSDYKLVGTATYAIDDKRIPCEVFEKQDDTPDGNRVTKIYYAANFSPRIVKQEQITTGANGDAPLDELTESIVAIDMPYRLSSGIVPTWQTKRQRKGPKGSTVAIEIHSSTIPGGLVAQSTKELDAAGRVLRRSTLELIDYGLESERALQRRRVFRSRRNR
ncbi:MAG: hypothetical protein KDA42_20015 [Planctomycetales bacterium]|nr:hypothetical protein [Planctomycetales bacterium]